MNNFTTKITSVPDKEKLAAEIWYKQNTMIAEINQKKDNLEVILFTTEKSNFELDELIEVLKRAKEKLLN